MRKIIIIGGGFGGLAAAEKLANSGMDLEITLIDKKETSDFLPLLPDCIGRGVRPGLLAQKIAKITRGLKCEFIQDEVSLVDLDKKEVFTKYKKLNYNYLVIASGTETNFYGNENIQQRALILDTADDARRIIERLKQEASVDLIIGGGGYTGIEAATSLRVYLARGRQNNRIVIVERAPEILGPLPDWMKDYVMNNLRRLQVEFLTSSVIEKIEGDRVLVSGDRVFAPALVVWTAGVKTAAFIQSFKVEKNPQGRIKVDANLGLNNSCFVVGDAAYFAAKDGFLRMAVQFALAEGRHVAINIIRSIKGLPLVKFRPRDLGYIIPMANNKSCGKVMGWGLKGRLPTILHFLMCIYRFRGLAHKFGLIRDLLKRR